MLEETYPLITGKLDDGTWMGYEPHLLLEENNTTAHPQHCGGELIVPPLRIKNPIKCVKGFPQL